MFTEFGYGRTNVLMYQLEGISNINNADKNVFSELKKIFLQKQKQGRL